MLTHDVSGSGDAGNFTGFELAGSGSVATGGAV
jgi:hypothetical protein